MVDVPFLRGLRRSPLRLRQSALDSHTHARALGNLGGLERSRFGADAIRDLPVAEVRALHTAAVVALAPDWIWPRWISQQIDPASACFTHTGDPPSLTNVTGRTWTRLGTLDEPTAAMVDPDGLVTPQVGGTSLDWWVRDASGWRFPSIDSRMSQSLVDGTPVVRTVMHDDRDGAPSSDGYVCATAYVVAGDPPSVIVELSNHTEAPVAVAFALRPYNLDGITVVANLTFDGANIYTNGEKFAALVDGEPAHVQMSTFDGGDISARMDSIPGGDDESKSVSDAAGLAHAAFVYALEQGSSVRIELPTRAPRSLLSVAAQAQSKRPESFPPVDAVTRGWRRQASEGNERGSNDRGVARFEFPDDRATRVMQAAPHRLLLFRRGDIDRRPRPAETRPGFPAATFVLRALGQLGMQSTVTDVLDDLPATQRLSRFTFAREVYWDALGASVMALGDHWRFTHDEAVIDELWYLVSDLESEVALSSSAPGMNARANAPQMLGPPDAYYWDTFFVMAAFSDVRELAKARGDASSEKSATKSIRRLLALVHAELDRSTAAIGRDLLTAGPGRGIDAGMIGSLAACYPLRVLAADDERVRATRDLLFERFVDNGRYFHQIAHDGWSVLPATILAGAFATDADVRAWDITSALLGLASPTLTWPSAIHPISGLGCFGPGDDAWAFAAVTSLLRDMCVRETNDGLALCSVVPDAWTGHDLTVTGAMTPYGAIDIDLRWDGDTAVLAWRGVWGAETPVLTAPGLAADWQTTDETGVARFDR